MAHNNQAASGGPSSLVVMTTPPPSGIAADCENGERHDELEEPAAVMGMGTPIPQVIGGDRDDEQQQHPIMTNDLILIKIFEYCRPKDLSSCRLVSPKWNNVSFPVWLKAGPPIALTADNGDNDKPVGPRYEKLVMAKFLQEFHPGVLLDGNPAPWNQETPRGIQQYRNFRLNHSDKNPGAKLVMNAFWKACGSWITNLQMVYEVWDWSLSRDFVGGILLCKDLPNLEHLDLYLGILGSTSEESLSFNCLEGEEHRKLKSFKFSGSINLSQRGWKILLSHYPNLKSFIMDHYQMMLQLRKILTAMQEIRQENGNKLLQLTKLSWLSLERTTDDLPFLHRDLLSIQSVHEFLRGCGFDLKYLGIFCNSDADEASVRQICSMYWKTLKEFRLYRSRPLPLGFSPFDDGREMMSQLETLIVGGYVFRDLLFLKDTPNLRTLKFMGDTSYVHLPANKSLASATSSSDMIDVFLPLVSTFSLNFGPKWSAKDIDKLWEWMPNIAHLEIPAGDEAFQGICKHFPNLEQMVVYGDDLGDKGLVGLEVDLEGRVTYNTPNITNLQKLRRFELCYRGWMKNPVLLDDDVKITEHSVSDGFLKLPRLESLKISVRPAKMDTRVMQFIKERIPFAELPIQVDWKHERQRRAPAAPRPKVTFRRVVISALVFAMVAVIIARVL